MDDRTKLEDTGGINENGRWEEEKEYKDIEKWRGRRRKGGRE